MKVAIIPARGGSKRIPGKNVRPFCGRPMIGWSVAAAQRANCFDRIIVSTDDEMIAETARIEGAEVPFQRPAELADDHVAVTAVMRHAMEWLQEQGESVTEGCCISATAPFVQPEDIRRGREMLAGQDISYAISVTTFPFPIQRAVRLTTEGRMAMFQPEHRLTRSQDLDEAYHDAAQFYWGQPMAWRAERPLFDEDSVPVILPRFRVHDIDTPEDWERAELIFRALYRQ